ncbi:MAG TPA: HemK family protein methyltransferase [Candidatus Absconditabacterales bacterium]|nr:HemK family protein methyltransferase [Candidatus Absconditabacterales bacterium]HMT27362.1 HemK family protein methyltransferase [Candidatus Absconditabacterales bacterium]
MTIEQLLRRRDLENKKILEKLICHYQKFSREEIFLKSEEIIFPEIIEKIERDYRSYQKDKKPLEYILGFVEFSGLKFKVSPATLIPRPETEYMLEAVKEHLEKSGNGEKRVLLDIGTGCGVLGLSTYKRFQEIFSEAYLSDIFENALEIAKENKQYYFPEENQKINIVKSNLCEFIVKKPEITKNKKVILIANLPYIPEETFENNVEENVKKREPKPAFVGGDDGLDYYRQMFDQILSLEEKPESLDCFLEMMTRQREILQKEYPQFHYSLQKTFHFNIIILSASL